MIRKIWQYLRIVFAGASWRRAWGYVSGEPDPKTMEAFRRMQEIAEFRADEEARERAEAIAARLTRETGRPHYAHRLTVGVWEPRAVAREGVAQRQAEKFEEWARQQDNGGPVSHG